MSKHTPGPWYAERYENGAFMIIKRRGNDPEIVLCERAPHSTMAEEFLANARLIAAAPEMVAALRLLIGRGRDVEGPIFDKIFFEEVALLARIEGDAP